MKKYLVLTAVNFLCAWSLTAAATEPVNIAVVKQKLKSYHDSGSYKNDVANVMQKALRYLQIRVKQGNFQGKPAIVLDIDETSLSNYKDMVKRDFGGSAEDIRHDEDQAADDAIEPTLKLYRFAKENHVAVFFVTGRVEEERDVTEKNLRQAGFVNHSGLVLRNGQNKNAPASVYKSAIRKELHEKGYDVILNIGDQQSDLRGGYADKTFKLPNPYYFIP